MHRPLPPDRLGRSTDITLHTCMPGHVVADWSGSCGAGGTERIELSGNRAVTMDFETILFLILGGLAGGFVNGFAGTGTAMFGLAFILIVKEPRQAVAIVALISVLAGLQGLWEVRREIANNIPRLLRFALPGLIGVPLGVSLLAFVDARTLRIMVGGVLILYGGYFGFRRALPRFDKSTPIADACVGLISGILGGLASLSGAIIAIWVSMRPWAKAETRAVMQPFNFTVLGFTVAVLAYGGAYTRDTWVALGVALPAGLVAAQIGILAFRRVNDNQFRRTLIILCLALGVGVLARELAVF